MCLIIACEPTRKLPVKKFAAAIRSAVIKNPDGIGLAWCNDGKVIIEKSVNKYEKIIAKAIEIYEHSDIPFVVHLRYNTVGKNSLDNTHPFRINSRIAMVHNKTLWIEPPNTTWSDSRTIAELMSRLCKGDRDFFGTSLFYSFIEHHADVDNRFVFLDAEWEQLVYINKNLGVEVDGVWFSNLYAWNCRTVGLRQEAYYAKPGSKSGKGSSITKSEYEALELIEEGIAWDSDDVPLAWQPAGVDRSFVENF